MVFTDNGNIGPLENTAASARFQRFAQGETNPLSIFFRTLIGLRIQWIQFRSSDGSMVLYFDPATKQVWGEGIGSESDSHMNVDGDPLREGTSGSNPPTPQDLPIEEDFSDDEINAAAHLASMVSYVVSPNTPGMW